jgi:cell division protein FtsB
VDKILKFIKRFPIVVGVVVLLLVLFAFTQQVAAFLRLDAQLQREREQNGELSATQNALLDQIAYATSQAAVEEWAREDARWSQDGDFVVLPVPPAGVTPQPAASFQATPTPSTNWDKWMNWLFFNNP